MQSIASWVDAPSLILLILANSTPVVLAGVLGSRYSAAIDASVVLRDGRPLFGSHKTWRGLAGGTLMSGIGGSFLATGFLTGAAFGALALTGDLLSSFLKRRWGRPSGSWIPLLDQLPEALLPMLVLRIPMGLDAAAIAGTAVLFMALDLLVGKRQR